MNCKRAWIWLRRIGHCRGFGIQSPSDYRFVRYVINEHSPYYAYAKIGVNDKWLRRKLGRLYFRLANYLQPGNVADLAGYSDYIHAGCRRANINNNVSVEATLVIAPHDADTSVLLRDCAVGTTLVVEDIGRHPDSWQAVVSDTRATVTFDLYYCGIAFFDPGRTKQHYIVNF